MKIKRNFRSKSMSYTIIQQDLWVGTHNDKKRVKQLIACPSSWCHNDGNSCVVYWPPINTKPTLVNKLLADPESKPDQTWEQQYCVIKRTKLPDLKMANSVLKSMQCTYLEK